MEHAISSPLLRTELLDRRERLEQAIGQSGEAPDLVRLLQQVDLALDRFDAGRFGRCLACHMSVEAEQLADNPLLEYCLCKLTPAQQTALERDLGLAGRTQWALLPKQNLDFAGWAVHYRYLPAGPLSGDYCDVVTRNGDDSVMHFMLGDVSGHGVAASFLMAHLNALFRSLIDTGASLAEIVQRANRLFSASTGSSQFATLVCGRATLTGAVELCNAGHLPPVVVQRDGVEGVEARGLPVGLFEDSPYRTHTLKLSPGDALVLYTDGLTESRNPADEEYGSSRLLEVLEASRGGGAAALAASCLEDHARFRAGVPRTDDLTLMVVRRVLGSVMA